MQAPGVFGENLGGREEPTLPIRRPVRVELRIGGCGTRSKDPVQLLNALDDGSDQANDQAHLEQSR